MNLNCSFNGLREIRESFQCTQRAFNTAPVGDRGLSTGDGRNSLNLMRWKVSSPRHEPKIKGWEGRSTAVQSCTRVDGDAETQENLRMDTESEPSKAFVWLLDIK